MKSFYCFLIIILSTMILGGCESKPYSERTIDFKFADDNASLNLVLSNCLSGKPIRLTEEWTGYSVMTEKPDTNDPSHELYSKIDDKYFIIRVSNPKSTKLTEYQDLVLLAFHTDDWNQNYYEVSKSTDQMMPSLIQSNGEHVLAISPYYYTVSSEGYDQLLDMLTSSEQMTLYEDGTYRIEGLQLIPVNATYDSDIREFTLNYLNQSSDAFLWKGEFKLEYLVDDDWQTIFISTDSAKSIAIEGGGQTSLVLNFSSMTEELQPGDLRVTIIYYRQQLYGMAYMENSYPIYSFTTPIKVDEAIIPMVNDYEDVKADFPGISLVTEMESYPVGTEYVNVQWINDSIESIMYGSYFTLEIKDGEGWQPVKLNSDDLAFTLEGYGVEPGSSSWYNYPIHRYTEGLVSGVYRISVSFTRMTYNGEPLSPGRYPKYYLSTNFKIEQ